MNVHVFYCSAAAAAAAAAAVVVAAAARTHGKRNSRRDTRMLKISERGNAGRPSHRRPLSQASQRSDAILHTHNSGKVTKYPRVRRSQSPTHLVGGLLCARRPPARGLRDLEPAGQTKQRRNRNRKRKRNRNRNLTATVTVTVTVT